VHGSRYPACKTIWWLFYKITTVKQWHFENPAKIPRRHFNSSRKIAWSCTAIDQSNCVFHCYFQNWCKILLCLVISRVELPQGAEFLFVYLVPPEKSQDKGKFRSARKIPPSGKRL
jgi:hypothetical protein